MFPAHKVVYPSVNIRLANRYAPPGRMCITKLEMQIVFRTASIVTQARQEKSLFGY
jgi:hypothetical protein